MYVILRSKWREVLVCCHMSFYGSTVDLRLWLTKCRVSEIHQQLNYKEATQLMAILRFSRFGKADLQLWLKIPKLQTIYKMYQRNMYIHTHMYIRMKSKRDLPTRCQHLSRAVPADMRNLLSQNVWINMIYMYIYECVNLSRVARQTCDCGSQNVEIHIMYVHIYT